MEISGTCVPSRAAFRIGNRIRAIQAGNRVGQLAAAFITAEDKRPIIKHGDRKAANAGWRLKSIRVSRGAAAGFCRKRLVPSRHPLNKRPV